MIWLSYKWSDKLYLQLKNNLNTCCILVQGYSNNFIRPNMKSLFGIIILFFSFTLISVDAASLRGLDLETPFDRDEEVVEEVVEEEIVEEEIEEEEEVSDRDEEVVEEVEEVEEENEGEEVEEVEEVWKRDEEFEEESKEEEIEEDTGSDQEIFFGRRKQSEKKAKNWTYLLNGVLFSLSKNVSTNN